MLFDPPASSSEEIPLCCIPAAQRRGFRPLHSFRLFPQNPRILRGPEGGGVGVIL